jgi:hypothetical protein
MVCVIAAIFGNLRSSYSWLSFQENWEGMIPNLAIAYLCQIRAGDVLGTNAEPGSTSLRFLHPQCFQIKVSGAPGAPLTKTGKPQSLLK